MALTVQQYVNAMRQRQLLIGQQLGVDLTGIGSKELRVLNLTTLAMIATLIEVVVINGGATDAQLNQTLNAAVATQWPEEPLNPEPPPTG